MTITVFGATGQVGKRVVHQALAKGYSVRAFGRNIEQFVDDEQRYPNLETIKGYVFDADEVYNAINGADAVISTLGGAFDGKDNTRSVGIRNIIEQMDRAGVKRIVALGGIGVLNETESSYLLHSASYKSEYVPVGEEHLQAYLNLKDSDLEWTFVCSPDIMNAGITGNFVTNVDYMPDSNSHKITAGDLAYFMLHTLEKKEFVNQRVGISSTE
jgi:putative NADH-flavin reductase